MEQAPVTLASARLTAFVATGNPARAKIFYGETLGLTLVSEDSFALVFDADGTTLRVSTVQQPVTAPYTVLGWEVPDITAFLNGLRTRGVVFERYPFMSPDGDPVWRAPDGTQVAWFKDPDGNTLSITQHMEPRLEPQLEQTRSASV